MLPAFRKAFHPSEMDEIMKPMFADFDWDELPHFYRQWFPDWPRIRAHATGPALGMPGFVFDWIEGIEGKCHRYEIETLSLLEELKDPSLHAVNEEKRLKARESCTSACVIN